ncbi:MAG: hypothetical protein ACK55W_05390 [Pseudomonadota bacterium]|jgi:hypothetical protein
MLPSVLAPFLPIVWVLLASAYWWRELSSSWLFLVVGLLAVFGIQAIVSFLWTWWPHIFGNYFLEASNVVAGKVPSEAELQRVFEEANRAAIIQATLVAVATVPLLWWLKSGLSLKTP